MSELLLTLHKAITEFNYPEKRLTKVTLTKDAYMNLYSECAMRILNKDKEGYYGTPVEGPLTFCGVQITHEPQAD